MLELCKAEAASAGLSSGIPTSLFYGVQMREQGSAWQMVISGVYCLPSPCGTAKARELHKKSGSMEPLLFFAGQQ
jgi:hypothetical protein